MKLQKEIFADLYVLGIRPFRIGGIGIYPIGTGKLPTYEKRPVKTGLLLTHRHCSAGAAEKGLRKTHYFQVGNHYLMSKCPIE